MQSSSDARHLSTYKRPIARQHVVSLTYALGEISAHSERAGQRQVITSCSMCTSLHPRFALAGRENGLLSLSASFRDAVSRGF